MLPVPVADIENFYPRPPRGGRRWVTGKPRRSSFYFYPRPPRGGRPGQGLDLTVKINLFLSTPSARRATQERKFP